MDTTFTVSNNSPKENDGVTLFQTSLVILVFPKHENHVMQKANKDSADKEILQIYAPLYLWCVFNPRTTSNLDVVQLNVLRFIYPKEMHVMANLVVLITDYITGVPVLKKRVVVFNGV